jgi:hypothetical protein
MGTSIDSDCRRQRFASSVVFHCRVDLRTNFGSLLNLVGTIATISATVAPGARPRRCTG